MPIEPADKTGEFAAIIKAVKLRMAAADLLTAWLLLAALLLLESITLVVADHTLRGGLTAPMLALGRYVLAATAAVILLLMALLPALRRISDLHIARLLERVHPEFKNDLTSAVELARDQNAHVGILAALRSRADRHVAGLDLAGLNFMRPAAAAALAVAGVAAIWLAVAIFSPKSIAISLARIAGKSLPPPTATTIESFSPQQDVSQLLGKPVDFQARVHHARGPVRVALTGSPDPAAPPVEWIELPRVNDGAGRDRYGRAWDTRSASPGVRWFHLVAGDTATAARKLELVNVPLVMQAEISVTWPPYTGRGVMAVQGQRIDALAGSRIAVSARTNVPAKKAHLSFESGSTIAAQIDEADPEEITAAFDIAESGNFSISFEDDSGNPNTVVYQVHVLEDAPPRVLREDESPTISVPADGQLDLKAQAQDDFGLANVELETRKALEHNEQPLAQFAPPGRTIAPVSQAIAASQLGKSGDRLLCRLIARDLKPPEGQVGATDWFTVIISDPVSAQPPPMAKNAADLAGNKHLLPGANIAATGPATAPSAEAKNLDKADDGIASKPSSEARQGQSPQNKLAKSQSQKTPEAPLASAAPSGERQTGRKDKSASAAENSPATSGPQGNRQTSITAAADADQDSQNAKPSSTQSIAAQSSDRSDNGQAGGGNAATAEQVQQATQELASMARQDQATLRKLQAYFQQNKEQSQHDQSAQAQAQQGDAHQNQSQQGQPQKDQEQQDQQHQAQQPQDQARQGQSQQGQPQKDQEQPGRQQQAQQPQDQAQQGQPQQGQSGQGQDNPKPNGKDSDSNDVNQKQQEPQQKPKPPQTAPAPARPEKSDKGSPSMGPSQLNLPPARRPQDGPPVDDQSQAQESQSGKAQSPPQQSQEQPEQSQSEQQSQKDGGGGTQGSPGRGSDQNLKPSDAGQGNSPGRQGQGAHNAPGSSRGGSNQDQSGSQSDSQQGRQEQQSQEASPGGGGNQGQGGNPDHDPGLQGQSGPGQQGSGQKAEPGDSTQPPNGDQHQQGRPSQDRGAPSGSDSQSGGGSLEGSGPEVLPLKVDSPPANKEQKEFEGPGSPPAPTPSLETVGRIIDEAQHRLRRGGAG